jgi:hypothetical protein
MKTDDSLEQVRAALQNLRYGEVVIAVHDGEIVQIARTEKFRTSPRSDPHRNSR